MTDSNGDDWISLQSSFNDGALAVESASDKQADVGRPEVIGGAYPHRRLDCYLEILYW